MASSLALRSRLIPHSCWSNNSKVIWLQGLWRWFPVFLWAQSLPFPRLWLPNPLWPKQTGGSKELDFCCCCSDIFPSLSLEKQGANVNWDWKRWQINPVLILKVFPVFPRPHVCMWLPLTSCSLALQPVTVLCCTFFSVVPHCKLFLEIFLSLTFY